jgi:hypothetical protein
MAGDHHGTAAGTVPFWAHQLAELLLGGLLLVEGARTGQHTAVLVSLGSALLVLSLTSDGPLGAWPWIGRRLHRVLDFAAAAALAASPLLLSLSAALPIVILEAAALGMVWLALRTNWAPRRTRGRTTPTAAAAPPPTPTASPEPPVAPGPPLARKLGSAVGKAKADGPRELGRAVGRIKARAKRPPAPDA